MTGSGHRDLSGLHRQIVAAKGGTFGAVTVSREAPPSLARRSYYRLLSHPRLGPAAHRVVLAARRVRGRRSAR
jgi:hypothetical protein